MTGVGDANKVLKEWPDWSGRLSPLSGGLINATYMIERADGEQAILQRLNTEIFTPLVHNDIDCITRILVQKRVMTPRLIPTANGTLWHQAGDASWRMMTVVGERTTHQLNSAAAAESAGALVGQWHSALAQLRPVFQSVRSGAHDTQSHMAAMLLAVDNHCDHRLFDRVVPIADEIHHRWRDWCGDLTAGRLRVIHGDLKVSNIRFCGDEAVALIDLDTMAMGHLQVELGDAMRSWCNPSTEEGSAPIFDLVLFAAAMRGYAQGSAEAPPTTEEWQSIVPGIERICLELAARFAADALNECYFGFDQSYGGRGEHNLARAIGQLGLARSVGDQSLEATKIVAVHHL